MNDPFVFFALALLSILFVLFLIVLILGIRYELVKQEERLVIYRFGRFTRLAGPGHVFYASRIETIERRINVREENKKISVEGVFIHGVPFGYTFDMWMRNDPQTAGERSGRPLAELAQFDDRERLAQAKVAIKNALMESLAQVEQSHPVSRNAPFVAKLLPIFPGQPAFEDLIKTLRQKLEIALPEIGVVAAAGRPISVVNIALDKPIIDGFNQGRSVTLLKEALPDLQSDQILEMVAKVNGIDLNYQRLQLNREGNSQADVDFLLEDDDGARARVRDRGISQPNFQAYRTERHAVQPVAENNEPHEPSTKPHESKPHLEPSLQPTREHPIAEPVSESITIPDQIEIPSHTTTASDWQVLKRLPR